MRKTHLLLAASAFALASAVSAAPSLSDSPVMVAQAQQGAATPMINGEVRKVDKDAGKITLKHDPIPNLEMPGMTMAFRVQEPSMLDKIKQGDKVRFAADKVGGALTVTRIEPAK
ncbi:MAG TPA: copper-binding protein [Casimicrobiaceae bacterium]|jgi:Cu/Ag efflux protein CusF